jgi:uncharacterized membrane protein YkvA (DUF1232 family)|tara:strand:- start:17 stop:406 length:390 start_codon:yes stop_codon:yes gene_type:complete
LQKNVLGLVLVDIVCPGGGIRRPACDLVADKTTPIERAYASAIELGTRQKLRFFRFVLTDRRVPQVVKLIPSPVAAYLANPIDLIPDFLPVVGYLDDVGIVIDGLALIVKMVPFELVSELIGRAKTESA